MIPSVIKVLIVDDSVIVGKRVQEILQECSSIENLGQAYNIDEGKKIIENKNPDLVILDIGFPVGSGMLLISEVKKRNSNAIVVMFTNYSHLIYRNKCKAMGADYFFDKSTELESLMDLLGSYKNQPLTH